MASSSRPMGEINALCPNLTLEEEEAGGIEVEEDQAEQAQLVYQWCLVGRFLTDKNIDFAAMRSMMASLWKPVKGMCIKSLNSNLFLFQFFHEKNLQWVIKGGPWSFNRYVLLTKKLEGQEQPNKVQLFHLDIWLQVYDLPVGFMSERVCKTIGNYVGQHIETDSNNFNGMWCSFM